LVVVTRKHSPDEAFDQIRFMLPRSLKEDFFRTAREQDQDASKILRELVRRHVAKHERKSA
jgi:hypothetical protein